MASLSASWRTTSVAYIALKRGASAPDAGVSWPAANGLTESDALILANVAPDAALAIVAGDNAQWLESLRARIGAHAMVTDQSGAYRILRLEGASARGLLASGVFIDLDPERFPSASTAAARCGHIALILMHLADGAFEVVVPRSYAESFLHWLKASAAMRNLPPIAL